VLPLFKFVGLLGFIGFIELTRTECWGL